MSATTTIQPKVIVNLTDRSYPIYIDSGDAIKEKLLESVRGNQVLIVSNTTVAPLYLNNICSALTDKQVDTVILDDGEQYKTQQSVNKIYDKLIESGHNRSTTLIALGGGVIGDMTGYAAACYQRGVDFIQIPTTLLSQVDSSVGGKTGINHSLGKNMIGAFKQPRAVFINTSSLLTLASREFSAGLAEVIKYGLLGDAEFFSWLEANMTDIVCKHPERVVEMIRHCCQMKADIVAEDEFEAGRRALLNFGHTFGHAIEVEMGYGNWLHGEAVAVGMVMATRMSSLMGHIDTNDVERVTELLATAKLPISKPSEMNSTSFVKHMLKDKKNISKEIRLILLRELGHAFITDEYPFELLKETIDHS